MRCLVSYVLAVVLTACGSEPEVPGATPSAPTHGTLQQARPAVAVGSAAEVFTEPVVATTPSTEQQRAMQAATATVTGLIAAAATADAATQGRAPATLIALGTDALPGLAHNLTHQNVTHRRIAALTLLQWSDSLQQQNAAAPVVEALAAARNDPDPAVRAAAEHAWRRAIGDTTALEQSRAAHEAAERASR